MERKLIRLSQRYGVALREHLKQGRQAGLQTARGWGRQAVAIGLETLDVARIHEGALAALESSNSRDGIIKRAGIFFTEAISPIESTHRAALRTNTRLSRLNRTLDRRTADLAASRRTLNQGITRRKTVERAFKKSRGHSLKLLKESRQLQEHLQRLTHRIFSAQEDQRRKISHDLRDEIAQTLLGINVRLVTLKKESTVNAASLRKEIANTRQLVDKSVKSINRFAREFGRRDQT